MKPEMKAQRRLERFLTRVKDLALAGESDAVGQAFCEPLEWPEPQRGYEAVRRLCQLILELGQFLPRQAWVELYAAAADGLADVLERTPAEPVLLNCAGVFLYELTQHDAAAVVFECALALDPSLPAAESNLAGAIDSSRRQGLLGRPQDRVLARRLCEIAAGADPAVAMTLSLCMIVKDEEELLPGCLEAVEAAVDEMIIVDTGSTDRTVEIAESFSARVLHVPWNGSFSDARNAGLDAATGDWVLYLDADEHLIAEDAPKIRELLGRTWREAFFIELTNLTGLEESGTAVVSPALRIFRNRPEYRFAGRIHEEVNGEMPTFLPERFEPVDVRALHLGYLDRLVAQRAKPARNLTLLKLESDEAPSPYGSFNLGSEYLRLAHWSTAAVHLDKAWTELSSDELWPWIGFAPLLALRTARARRECGRIEEAREVLDQALERLPQYTDLVFELAQCSIELGDLPEAERLLERCLELGDAPAGLVSTVGAGSRLAREQLTRLRQAPELAHAL